MSFSSTSIIISHWEEAQKFSDEGRFHDAIMKYELSKLLLLEEGKSGGKISEIAVQLLDRINKELTDHYSLLRGNLFIALGVRKDCTMKHVRKAYKHFVKKYHPDKNVNLITDTTELFQIGQTAHEVLSADIPNKSYLPTMMIGDWLRKRAKDGLAEQVKKTSPILEPKRPPLQVFAVSSDEGSALPRVTSPSGSVSSGSGSGSDSDNPKSVHRKHHRHHHRRHHRLHKSSSSSSSSTVDSKDMATPIRKHIGTVVENESVMTTKSVSRVRRIISDGSRRYSDLSTTAPSSSTSTSFSSDNDIESSDIKQTVKWGKTSVIDDEEDEQDISEVPPLINVQAELSATSFDVQYNKRASIQVDNGDDDSDGNSTLDDDIDEEDWDFAFDLGKLRWGSVKSAATDDQSYCDEDEIPIELGRLPSIKGADVPGGGGYDTGGGVFPIIDNSPKCNQEINWKEVFAVKNEEEESPVLPKLSSLPNLFS